MLVLVRRGRRRWSESGGGEAAMKVNGAGEGVRPAGRASFPSLRGGREKGGEPAREGPPVG